MILSQVIIIQVSRIWRIAVNNKKFLYKPDDSNYQIIDHSGLSAFYPVNTYIPYDFRGDSDKNLFTLHQDIPSNNDILKKIVSDGDPFFDEGLNSYRQNYVVVDITPEEKAKLVEERIQQARQRRQDLLDQSDWVVAFYTENSLQLPLEWRTYRQSLRDLPGTINETNFLDVQWPEMPVFKGLNI